MNLTPDSQRPIPLHKTLANWCWCAVIIAALMGWVVPRSAAAKKVIRLEAIKVEGRIQKPQAFYILQRSNLNFEGVKLERSFLPKIVKSVDKKPF